MGQHSFGMWKGFLHMRCLAFNVLPCRLTLCYLCGVDCMLNVPNPMMCISNDRDTQAQVNNGGDMDSCMHAFGPTC